MKKYVVSAGIALLSSVVPLQAHAAALFSELYVFGDSLTDTGNLFNITNGQAPPSPPNGPYAQRQSNGLVWVEYLANDFGLSPGLSTDPSADFSDGISSGVIGAGTGTGNLVAPQLDSVLKTGALAQVEQFTKLMIQPADDALFIYQTGGNDILNNIIRDPNRPSPDLAMESLPNTKDALSQLAEGGAKNLFVSNVPNVAKTPLFNQFMPLPNDQLAGISALVNDYNGKLFDIVDQLSLEFPEVHFIKFDFNKLLLEAIEDPSEFGFVDVTNACFFQPPGDPAPPPVVSCNLDGNNPMLPSPDNFLWWDGVHPTTKGHEFIARDALRQLHESKAVPEPGIAIGLFTVGAVAVGAARRRRSSDKAA